MTQDNPETLEGGNSNQVIKDGNSVIRQCGPWSSFVHSLLRHLAKQGFNEAPILLETDGSTERLSFLEGDVGNDPLKPYVQTDEVLVEAAHLLRRFHDTSQGITIPKDAVFLLQLPENHTHEVICHNDFAPYNLVFNDGHLTGIIDFDTAAPGSRLWDVAYAAYRFAPLKHDDHCRDVGWTPIPDKAQRLKLFCDAYGLDDRASRATLVDTMIERLQHLIAAIRRMDTTPEHIATYARDIAYLRANKTLFTQAIL